MSERTPLMKKLAEAFRANQSDAWESFGKRLRLPQLRDWASDAASGAGDWMSDTAAEAGEFGDRLTDELGRRSAELGKSVGRGIDQAGKGMRRGYDTLSQVPWSEVPGEMADQAAGWVDAARSGIDTARGALGRGIESAGESLSRGADSFGELVRGGAAATGKAIGRGIDATGRALSRAPYAVRDAHYAARDAFKDTFLRPADRWGEAHENAAYRQAREREESKQRRAANFEQTYGIKYDRAQPYDAQVRRAHDVRRRDVAAERRKSDQAWLGQQAAARRTGTPGWRPAQQTQAARPSREAPAAQPTRQAPDVRTVYQAPKQTGGSFSSRAADLRRRISGSTSAFKPGDYAGTGPDMSPSSKLAQVLAGGFRPEGMIRNDTDGPEKPQQETRKTTTEKISGGLMAGSKLASALRRGLKAGAR